MNKILFSIILILGLVIASIFLTPISFISNIFLKNNNDLKIEYSYLDGNILSGSVLDLYVNNQALGDYSYETSISTSNIKIKFLATDNQDISGTFIKSFDTLDPSIFTINNFIAEETISLELIQNVNLKFNIKELKVNNFECETINGSIFISADSIRDELYGDLSCREGDKIITNLKNNKNKNLGSIQYHDSSIKVSISTKTLPDRRLQLLTDEVSFTIDL
tara:strand:- start:21 stop:683 length:663 start_codon:yes stop_codon:yes gene_type:complete